MSRIRLATRTLLAAVGLAIGIAFINWCLRDNRCAGDTCRIDLLEGDLAANWSVFGGLTVQQIHLSQGAGITDLEIDTRGASFSRFRSGIAYTAGLFSPGWYEFTSDFRVEDDQTTGVGAQLEVKSDRWRFIASAQPGGGRPWTHVDVFFRPADADPTAEISCRVWSAKPGNAAKVLFQTMQIRKVEGPPPQSKARFDLQRQEAGRLRRRQRDRLGSITPWGFAMALLAALAGIFWRLAE